MRGLKDTCLGFCREEIEYICSVYDSESETIDVLQERWPDRPRWHFTRVAQRFGVAKSGPPRWTEQEETFLTTNRHMLSPKEVAERLGRSETAVRLKLKRLGYTWIQGVAGFFTARAVGRLFGVDSKAVAWWIDSRCLKGDRFPIGLGPYRARRISWDAMCGFICDERYWHIWDPRRMRTGSLRDWAEEIRNGRGRFIGTREFGEMVGYELSWINELIRRGVIKARKHGPNWKIPMEEVARFRAEYLKKT